jgi:ATP-binding cassette subfamily B protein
MNTDIASGQWDVDDCLSQLGKVLRAHGIAATRRAIFDAAGGDLSIDGMLRALRQCGVDARLAAIGPSDLPFLVPHSLVWVGRGPPVILIRAGARGACVELPTNERKWLGRRALRALNVRALAVGAPPARQGAFIGRVIAALRTDPRFVRAASLVVFLGLLTTALGVGTTGLLRVALNEAIAERGVGKLTAVAAGMVLLSTHIAWAEWLRRRAVVFLEVRLSQLGTEELVRHLLCLPYARLADIELGQVLELTRGADRAGAQLVTVAMAAVDGFVALGYLAFVFWLDLASGLTAATGALVLLAVGFLLGGRTHDLRVKALAAGRTQQQGLFEIVAGVETVKGEAAEDLLLTRYLSRLLYGQGLAIREQSLTSLEAALSIAIDRIVYGVLLMLITARALQGQANIGDLLAAIQACAMFFVRAQTVGRLWTTMHALNAQAERIDELLSLPAEPLESHSHTDAAPEDSIAVALHNVWFRYNPSSPWVLRGVTVSIPRGARVAIEWPSGAGKSTLLRVISGLLAPERGDALVFGTEATRARHLVSYLPQHASLLPISILENLKLLSGRTSLDRIRRAATETGLADVVAAWPMGFDTILASGGTNVSSGQCQLVLFTAAVASEAPVLLLDEAFAHMDGSMRARLGSNDLLRGRTVILVVHDSTVYEQTSATARLRLGAAGGAVLVDV